MIITSNINFNDDSGWQRSKIDNAIFILLNDFIHHFPYASIYGLYFSSDFSLREVNATLEYFRRIKLITRATNEIELIPENLEKCLNILNLKITIDTNKLFKDVGILYTDKNIVFMIMPFSKDKFD